MQIKRLTQMGEILEIIRAPRGKLTVLRSADPSELRPVLRALSGTPSGERIVLTLQGETLQSSQIELVGFGESFVGDTRTVEQFLTELQISEISFTNLSAHYDISVSKTAVLATLPENTTRALRLLAVTVSHKPVIALNNPFNFLTAQQRETWAEAFLQIVERDPDRVVIIGELPERPVCFVGSELINRVEVGNVSSRTIGIPSQASELNALLAKIRSDAISVPSALPGTALPGSSFPEVPAMTVPVQKAAVQTPPQSSSGAHVSAARKAAIKKDRTPMRALVLFGLLVMVGTLVLLQKKTEPAPNVSLPSELNPVETPEITPEPTLAALSLELYSPVIRASLLNAYEGKSSKINDAQLSGVTQQKVSVEPKQPKNIFKLLEGAGGKENSGGDNSSAPEYVPPTQQNPYYPPIPPAGMPPGFSPGQSSTDSSDWEKRREEMRRRFLESIQGRP